MNFDYDYKIEHIQVFLLFWIAREPILKFGPFNKDICYIDEPYIYYLNFLDLPDDIEKRYDFLVVLYFKIFTINGVF